MGKTNISFNDKNYSIDESSLSAASAALKSHLSTVMNGTGATINLDRTSYGIDATKLTAATNGFITHLGTISGTGKKVTVGGVEYGIGTDKVASAVSELENHWSGLNNPDAPTEILEGDGQEFHKFAPCALTFRSTAPLNELQEVQINGVTVDPSNYTLEEGSTVVTLPIEYLKTLDVDNYEITVVSDSKSVKGGFTVVQPELNEHGFYYNQPYTANLPMFGGDTAFFVREDGTYDIITVGKNPDTGEYTIDGNNIVATHPMLGTLTCTISADGKSVYCNQVATTFELNGSTSLAADEDYFYSYVEDLGGYEVSCIDKTKAEYSAIKTGINGIDTVKLADEAFYLINGSTNNLLSAPEIPNSITIIGDSAFRNCEFMKSIILPNSVTSIGAYAFSCCYRLHIIIPDSVTSIGECAFIDCGLANDTIIIPDSVTSIGERAFAYCNMVSVSIGVGVTEIDDGTFQNCTALETVQIPATVTTIGLGAFSNCTYLTKFIYSGTMSQWEAITKESDWDYHTAMKILNGSLTITYRNYTIQCVDGELHGNPTL